MPPIDKLGRYQIVRELSEGAMGTVFEAVDPLIERTVAIKTIKLDFSKDELASFEQRFLREAKSAGRLNHPNIVTIYDVGESDNVAYLAMEYLEGQTLREVLDSGVALPVGRAAWIAAQIAEALSYADEHGVVHRDVKPANIILTRRGAVKLTDFGIAVLPMGSRTQSGTVMGSPKYMSPEQALGHKVDTRSDIFSLGIVLYEMLTGMAPFDGDNLNAILYRVINEEPATPRSFNSRVPSGLERIVMKMLEKRPERRYQNARQLARELQAYQTSPVTGAAATAANDKVDAGALTIVCPPVTNRGRQAKHYFYVAAACAMVVLATALPVILSQDEQQKVVEPLPITVATPIVPQPPASASSEESGDKVVALSALEPEMEMSVDEPQELQEPAKPRPLAPASGTLSFAIAPWGEVYVNSKRVGVSPPMSEFKLPAGRHTVEIRNSSFVPYSETIIVAPASKRKIKHRFQ
jgi:serine/threonine-protein kinase